MLTRRETLVLASASILQRAFGLAYSPAWADENPSLGLDNSFRYVSQDKTTDIVCFTDVDLLSGIVGGTAQLLDYGGHCYLKWSLIYTRNYVNYSLQDL